LSTLALLTGATGFVGGRLLRALQGERPVRCLVRDRSRLQAAPGVEVVEGDLGDPEAVRRAVDGVDVAWFLVHSMEAGGDPDFARRDLALAAGMADGAAAAGVRRLVYLGGVRPQGEGSEHLRSRGDVEDRLAAFGGEFVALRASMVVGAGSASFDTLAQLVERLPLLALPTWRDRRSRPVAIDDVVAALVRAADVAPGRYDVAGPDELSFAEMIDVLTELLGAHRATVDLPFSSSALEGAAAALVTDQDRELLAPLMAGLDADLLPRGNDLPTTFGVTPTPFRAAAAQALRDAA
jgi:uncharacterized protein YbjT (DUF2867 family)